MSKSDFPVTNLATEVSLPDVTVGYGLAITGDLMRVNGPEITRSNFADTFVDKRSQYQNILALLPQLKAKFAELGCEEEVRLIEEALK